MSQTDEIACYFLAFPAVQVDMKPGHYRILPISIIVTDVTTSIEKFDMCSYFSHKESKFVQLQCN